MRRVLTVLAVAFTGYLAARSLFWTGPVASPPLMVLALVLYLATTWLCVFWGVPDRHGDGDPAADRLPAWLSVVALGTTLVLPPLLAVGAGADAVAEPYSTWYIGGLGVLMVILIARSRPWPAWTGTAILAVWSSVLLGPLGALGLGLVGSLVWVSAAQFFALALGRAAQDTERLGQIQRSASAVQAAQGSQQRERRIQVQRALQVAGPVLARTIATDGRLDERDRMEARIAEGRLRDELRAARLLDDEVRAALDAARRRGAVVSVLDEGGLDGLSEESLGRIRADLAAVVRQARSERLYVRASPDPDTAVTVVGRAASVLGLSDEDHVDLWREIPRPEGRERDALLPAEWTGDVKRGGGPA